MSLATLLEFLIRTIENLGYFGIFLGTFLESFIVPIPSELLMGFAGFLIFQGKFNWFGVIIAAVLGNAVSSALIWWLGHHYGKNFVLKWGRFIGFDENNFEKSEKLFTKYGYFAIFICQLLPALRSIISIPAGVLRTRFVPFMVCTVAGATIWLTFLTYLGVQAGANWQNITNVIKPFEHIILYGLIVFTILFIGWWIWHLRQKKLTKAEKLD